MADFRWDDLDIFFRSVRQQGLVFSTICSDGEELQACVPWRFLQPIFIQWVVDLVASSEWLLRSSKPYLAMMFASVPFPYHLFSAIFELRQAADDHKKKKTNLFLLCTLIF